MARSPGTVGIFTTDDSLVVQTWDPWMADVTGIPETAACGEPLASLYPELAERGLLARLRRVATGAGVDVLAPALHKFLIPCAPVDRSSRFDRMRQHVTMAPLRSDGAVAGVIVTIEDVTARFDRDAQLAADLDSADDSVRLRAAQEIAARADGTSLLSTALGDDSWRVRNAAAEGLAASGGREVVETLVEALRDHHRNPALLNAALTALARTREDVVMAIVPLLDADDADVRTYAALALGLMGDRRAVPPLMSHLDDPDANVSFHAIEALGRIGDRRAADAIVAIAARRDFFLAFAALDALALIDEPSVVTMIVPLLDDEMLGAAAATCLGTIGMEEEAIPLAALIGVSAIPVSTIAVALACIHERTQRTIREGALVADLVRGAVKADAAHTLIASIDDASDEDANALALVASWFPSDAIDRALVRLLRRERIRDVIVERLGERGVSAAPYLAELAADDDANVRRAVAIAAGRIGHAASVPMLTAMIACDDDADVLVAAATALGAIGDRGAFEPLLALLDRDEATVRQTAVAALNSIGHPDMERVVAIRLADASPGIRESAARIAGYFGYASCLPGMLALCDDESPLVRRATLESLGNYDDAEAWERIHRAAASDPDSGVRAAAVRALARSMSDESREQLVHAFTDASPWVRYYAARAAVLLGSIDPGVIASLIDRATRDQAVPTRIAAIESLGILAPDDALPTLLDLARDDDDDIACAALSALGNGNVARSANVLLPAIETTSVPRRQRAALNALARQKAAHAVPAIAALTRASQDGDLRHEAVLALRDIGDARAIHELVQLSATHQLRAAITAVLAGLDEKQVPLLQDELSSATDEGREVIVDAAGRMKHRTASRLLASCLEDSSSRVRLAAARGLRRLDGALAMG